jgi:hypothetical protein
MSGHLSLVDVEQSHEGLSPASPHLQLQRPVLHSTATDLARQSYMTSDTFTSHMSGLSEFPVPPGAISLTPILNSYTERGQRPQSEGVASAPDSERAARRMTFGQDESDAEHILATFPRDV